MRIRSLLLIAALLTGADCMAQRPAVCDVARAKEICDSLTLRDPEGIWIYPDDNVTVLILREEAVSSTELPRYAITVVDTSDVGIRPGEQIGTLVSTADPKKFSMNLFTERKKDILSKSRECTVTLGNDGETLMLPKQTKKGLRLRFSINPSTLLPKMWRIVRFGTSSPSTSSKDVAPVGMVKIHPSYDGNGSSKRAPRYL